MNSSTYVSARPVYVSMLLFFLIVFFYHPVFAPEFGYLNDYTAFMPLSFGFPESTGLLYIGRPIQALIANIQFRFLGDMLSLQLMRVFIVLSIAALSVYFFRYLKNNLNISAFAALVFSALVFTLPSMAINSFYIAQSAPGIAPLFFVLIAHHLIHIRNSDNRSPILFSASAFLLIFLSLLTYPPATFFFLTLTFIKFIFGPKDAGRAKLSDIFSEVLLLFLASAFYFLFVKFIYRPFLYGPVEEVASTYSFILSSDIFGKLTGLEEIFIFDLSAWFPPLEKTYLIPIGIMFVLIVTWATFHSPYLRNFQSKSLKIFLGFVLSALIPIALAFPVFIVNGDYPILYRVSFASMAAVVPLMIVFSMDRALLAGRKGLAFVAALVLFSPYIFWAELASFHRVELQVQRLTMEYEHVVRTVYREFYKPSNYVNGHRIIRVPPFASPPDPFNYLYRDFGYTSVDSSPEAMVRSVIQSIDAAKRYYSGNKNLDGFQVSYDPNGQRYEARINEGITFSQKGYPDFISGYKGIAREETWGRWTDSEEAVIEFVKPLPRKFTLKIKAGTSSESVGKPVKIIIGNTQFEKKFDTQEATEVVLNVTTDGNAKSIIFKFPELKSPKELGLSADTRRLGLALVKLKIDL